MAKFAAWMFVFLAVSAVFLNVHVRAETEEEDKEDKEEFELHEEEETTTQTQADDDEVDADYDDDSSLDEVTSSSDIETSFVFPEYPTQRLEIGEKITLLVNMFNTGEQTFNVTAITAALHSPYDISYYIQNFTAREVGALLGPKQQVSLEYVFMPDKGLEPLEFWLSAVVYYSSSETTFHRSTIINGTIELVDKSSSLDARRMFSYLLVSAAVCLLAYLALNGAVSKRVQRSKAAARRLASEAGTQQSLEGWVSKDVLAKTKAVKRRA